MRPDSPQIAEQSYLLTTEDDYVKAVGMGKVMLEEETHGVTGYLQSVRFPHPRKN